MEIPAFGTILCPIDLSDHSKAALHLAAGLANRPDSKLVVLYVDAAAHRNKSRLAAARTRLNQFIRDTVPAWVCYREGTETILRDGQPSAAILGAAEEMHVQLIVMGTRGRSALGRALLGSTAAEVLRQSPVPVAVVPATDRELVALEESGSRPHLGVVLVPVDLTSPSSDQLAWAQKVSVSSGHRLLMLHVVPEGTDPNFPRERMRALAKAVETSRGFRLLVREGSVADEICHVIRHDGMRFVVLGRDAAAPGKLAYRVLQDTRAVVVMVPGRAGEIVGSIPDVRTRLDPPR
jgi:nucleotide-binding universal stress UspA family protein